MNHDEGISNNSDNRPFHDVLRVYSSRRDVLAGGLATAATTFFGATSAAEAREGWGQSGSWSSWWHRGGPGHGRRELIGFSPVPVAAGSGPVPTISDDYEFQVLIPYGTALAPGVPSWDGDGANRPTAAEAAEQVGIGHDGMWFFPMKEKWSFRSWGKGHNGFGFWDDRDGWWGNGKHGRASTHGVLAINHEFGTNFHVLGKDMPESLEDVRISQHSHGVSCVELTKRHGEWQVVRSYLSRRIHINTPVLFSGPVAGHALLETPAGNFPAGTANNCANGYTPWGTYLTCEENFNGYFGATVEWTPTEQQQRYGFATDGFGYGWHLFDPRFDLSNPEYRNEENRFGWIVEIDPMRPWQPPVKRTGLGRFKHEGVALAVGKGGRVVGYMGDDEAFDYIYKFVSSYNWKWLTLWGLSPLDHGTLYVARFNDDGSGDWLELTIDNPALAAQFADQAEVLTYARLAADVLGATPMDRPEWTSVAPNGEVYCTLTNNTGRTTPNAANPSAPNPDGHIIRWRDSNHHVGTRFTWEIFLLAADKRGTEETFTDPDGIFVDPDGRVFIQTDGGQPDGLNNQMVVAHPKTAEVKRLFTGVTGDEITGMAFTPDRRTMFINTQHPGGGDPTVANFPAPQGSGRVPRDSTVVIRRKDGGIIGS